MALFAKLKSGTQKCSRYRSLVPLLLVAGLLAHIATGQNPNVIQRPNVPEQTTEDSAEEDSNRLLNNCIPQQAYPYVPPPTNFPPDQWGNTIPDFSQVGYRSGNVPLPTVPVKVTLQPSIDPTIDDRLRIQTAIDYVGRLPLTPLVLRDGSTIMARGAVLLQAGFYRVAGSLILKDSGVVLRGEGNRANGTIIIATGDFRHDFILLNGLLDPTFQGTPQYQAQYGNSSEITPKSSLIVRHERMSPVADEYVPAGTRRVPVKDIQRFHVGQNVVVERQAKDSWVNRLGTSHIPKRPADPSKTMDWDPRQYMLMYMRTVTGIERRDKEKAKEAAQFAIQNGRQIFMAKKKQRGAQAQELPRKKWGLGPRREKARLDDDEAARRLSSLQGYVINQKRLERIEQEQREYLGGESLWPGSSAPDFSRTDDQNKFSTVDTIKKMHSSTPPANSSKSNDQGTTEDDPNWVPGYLTIDIPLTMNMDPIYGGGNVYNLERETPIPQDIGIENMALWSEHSPTNPEDERHAWYAVIIDYCEHCWAADIRTRYFVSGIKAASGSKHVTIQDCSVTNPVSLREEGGRRYMFMLQGQMGLVKRCFASDSRHDFLTGARTSGPNVFVDSEGIRANNDAGPHDRWTTGSLYDNIRSNALNVRNRGWMGTGQGWAGVFHVVFRCAAKEVATFQSPPGGTNWVIDFHGRTGEAYIQFPGDDATFLTPDIADLSKIPRSLYWAQLVARVGGTDTAALRLESLVGVKGKNSYPAPLARQFVTAEVVKANEAGQWPEPMKGIPVANVEEESKGDEHGVADEVGGQNTTAEAIGPEHIDRPVTEPAKEANKQSETGGTAEPGHVDRPAMEPSKEVSNQSETGGATEPEHVYRPVTEQAKEVSNQSATGGATEPEHVNRPATELAKEVSNQNETGGATEPEHVNRPVAEPAKEVSNQSETGGTAEPGHVDRPATELAKEVSSQNETGGATEPEHVDRPVAEPAKEVSNQSATSGATEPEHVNRPATELAKEVSGQSETSGISEPEHVNRPATELAKEVSSQNEASGAAEPEHVNHPATEVAKESGSQTTNDEASEPEHVDHPVTAAKEGGAQ